ncbi:hypothetical protein ACFYUJ_27645 [Streptomyces sp. NPDC004520]|uniref:hypothetical protein n=1 Tax=Streptomyces sp. NPDC004520 TaxID=3364702 RepID=UPI003684E7C4
MRLLYGTELDTGPDREVDWPDAFLTGFDICVATVHSDFGFERAAMPRLIGKRPGLGIDTDEVRAACARRSRPGDQCPGRPALPRRRGHPPRQGHGVRFAIGTDARSIPRSRISAAASARRRG